MLQAVPLILNLSGGEILIVLLVILMFFGSKGVPGIARGMGRAMRQFRDASQDIRREIRDSAGGIEDQVREVEQKAHEDVRRFGDNFDISKEIEEKE